MSGAATVTFMSDFGSREYYVGAVKGAVLSACPQAQIIDISHEIPSHDILGGAFTAAGAFSVFPRGTIHLVVVDPGVGSERRGIIVQTENYLFVAPDNGVLSMVLEEDPVSQVVAIEAEHHFRQPVSPTFHGRDIFGPVAGGLARGIDPNSFGPVIRDCKRLNVPPVRRTDEGVEGFVLHIDKFGNVVTSLKESQLEGLGLELGSLEIWINGHNISRSVRYYAEAPENSPVALVGSLGYIEVVALKKPASRIIDARRGMKVRFSSCT